MKNLILIAGYTLVDQLRQKSFIALLVISMLFLFMLRGCYGGNYVVNGKVVDSLNLVWHASIIGFHVISVFMFLMSTLLAMRVFSRDSENGSLVMFLSRPVSRWQYAGGRVAGLWLFAAAFMFTLHLTVYLIVWSKTEAIIPGYLLASLAASLSLIFVILCTVLLSLFLPDVMSAFLTLLIVTIGFVSDGGHRLLNSELVRSSVSSDFTSDPGLWRIFYPKVFMVQSWAGTLISRKELVSMGTLHPVFNLCIYILILGVLLLAVFRKREI